VTGSRFRKFIKDRAQYSPVIPSGTYQEMQKRLPGLEVVTGAEPGDSYVSRTPPGLEKLVELEHGVKANQISVPAEGKPGMDILMHEYTHAVDPLIKARVKTYADNLKTPSESEIPAMATERAVEASPYLPAGQRRPFKTPMGKQIEKFGPTLRGRVPQDLRSVENWMQGLRRMPNAGIQAKKPFAYHGDTRTPQQRAQALGVAYQNWMNRQAGQ
jgi:hypothetical protein